MTLYDTRPLRTCAVSGLRLPWQSAISIARNFYCDACELSLLSSSEYKVHGRAQTTGTGNEFIRPRKEATKEDEIKVAIALGKGTMVPLKASSLFVVYTWMDTYATYITKRDGRYGRHNHIQTIYCCYSIL